MSKLLSCLLILLAIAFSKEALSQTVVEATIKIEGSSALVQGAFAKPVPRLEFLDSYAGISGLAYRVTDREPGTGPVTTFSYRISLKPLRDRSASAHTSWVGEDVALLTLDDLLPQSSEVRTGSVRIILPVDWSIYPKPPADGTFHFLNADKTAFFLGRKVRSLPITGGMLNIAGDWHFTDAEAAKLASQVYASYSRSIGAGIPAMQVNIVKFPTEVQLDQWEADTRGSTVTIVSSDTPFESQSIQRLHEQLRHELFHLWIPNGVNLSGSYDWFYEGFALYQSLKLGVAVNRIRFDDYVNTLSRAYNIDNLGSRRVSLIDASRSRFAGSNTQVYARGMLVTFLCDLAMLENSKGKRSTDDLVSNIYRKYPLSSPRTDGNTAILSLMKASPELVPIVDRYITGAEPIDWALLLKDAGLEAVQSGREANLRPAAKPSGRQKDILDKLGYNNWRKSGSK